MLFDKKDDDSPFLSFVRKEFYHGRGTPLRAELSKKERVTELLEGVGIKWPQKLAIVDDLSALEKMNLPSEFVLKYAGGWSSRGVMLLEKLPNQKNQYFEHLSQRCLSTQRIVTEQNDIARSFGFKENNWIIEQKIPSMIPGKVTPFDYKFYTFQGEVGLIVQVDRNANPPRVSLFDGSFRPLTHKQEFVFKSKNGQIGVPIIPFRAKEMLYWAKRLSLMTDSPFVSVDLYDGHDAVYFGEFTFSPGGTQKRMWAFEHQFIERLDELFHQAEMRLNNGEKLHIEFDKKLPNVDMDVFARHSAYTLNNGPRGAVRMSELFAGLAEKCNGEHQQWCLQLQLAWKDVANALQKIQQGQLADRLRFLKKHAATDI